MKKIVRLPVAVLAAILICSITFGAFASFTTGSILHSGKYKHQDQYRDYAIAQGIDVSNHNDSIDWAKVKAAGVEFVIIRVGYRGYGSSGKVLEDTMYKEFLEGAHEQGLDIGVYFYSQALNTTEAKEEAEFVMKRIKPYKDYITLPVYFDYEFATYSGRLDTAWRNGKLNKTKMTNNVIAFCTIAEKNGFDAGVYASKYFFYDNVDYETLQDKYSIWMAHYSNETDYEGNMDLWQFSAKGHIDGISGNVDSNFRYYYNRFTADPIEPAAYTGKRITVETNIYFKDTLLEEGKDYTVTYQKNKEIGTASMIVKGIGDYSDIQDETFTFDIVPPQVEQLSVTKQSAGSVSLCWQETLNSSGYQVWYLDNKTWVKAGVAKTNSYTVTGLEGAKPYRFRVQAYKRLPNGVYFGADSDVIKTYTLPKRITSLHTTAVSSNSITLAWEPQEKATGYALYQYHADTETYEYVRYVKGGKNTARFKNLQTGTAYYFRIKPIMKLKNGTVYEGAMSKTYKEYTSPAAPTVKSVLSLKTKIIRATWKQSKNATGYEIMWSTAKDFSHNYKYITVAGGNNKAEMSTAQSGITYYVRIRSYRTYRGVRHYSSWSRTYPVIVQ